MENKIILFDWDDTLFSKVKYKRGLRNNLAAICEVSENKIFEHEEKYFDGLIKSGDFRIDDFINSFSQKFSKRINLEDYSTDNLGIYSEALFPDTIEALEKLKKEFILGIFSQGFDKLQRIKIRFSGIENFFDQKLFFISRDKTNINFVRKLPKGAMIIDDKKEVIGAIRKAGLDLGLVWINRRNEEKLEGMKTITSLKELG